MDARETSGKGARVGGGLWAALAISFAMLAGYTALLYRTSLLEGLVAVLGCAIMLAVLLVMLWARERRTARRSAK